MLSKNINKVIPPKREAGIKISNRFSEDTLRVKINPEIQMGKISNKISSMLIYVKL